MQAGVSADPIGVHAEEDAMGWLRRLLAAALPCLALALALAGRPAPVAAESGGVALSASAGFGGLARAGHMLPISVDVSNTGPDRTLDLTAALQTSAATQPRALLPMVPYRARYHLPVMLPNGSHKRVTLHLPLSALASGVVVQAWQGASLVATTTAPLTEVSQRQPFVAVVSDLAAPLPGLAAASLPGLSGSERPAVAALLTTDLPTEPDELDALDMLVLTRATTKALSGQQRLALQGWTAEGGALVLSGGASWPAVSAWLPSDLLPAPADAPIVAGDLTPMGTFAGASAPAGTSLVVSGGHGRVLAGPSASPLLSLLPYGAGSVIFSAADLAGEPLLDWSGGPALWQRLLTITLPERALAGPAAPPPFVGAVDLMGNALANVPQTPPRAWPGLAALLIGYVVALPLLLLLLRRLRRSALGLVLLPAAALGVAAVAFGVAAGERGGPVVVDAVTITEVPPGAAVGRVSAYYALFAPAEHAYHLQFDGGGVLAALTPQFVKRYPQPVDTASAEPPNGLDLRQDGTADLLPIAQWTNRGLVRQRWLAGASPVQTHVSVTTNGVSGAITNAGAQPLEDAAVISPWGVVALGTLAPGQSAPFGVTAAAGMSPQTQLPGYGGSPVGVPPEQFRAAQFRQQVMNAYLVSRGQGGADPALGPLQFMAWTAPAEPAPSIDGRRAAESGAGLLLVGLPIPAAPALPPGLLPVHLESILGASTAQGSRLALNRATLAATAILPAPPAVTRSVTLRLAVVGNNGGGLPSVSAYNRLTGQYDTLRLLRRVAAPAGPAPPPKATTGTTPRAAPGVLIAKPPLALGAGVIEVDATLGPGGLAAYVGSDNAVRFQIDAGGNTTLALPITYGYSTTAAPL